MSHSYEQFSDYIKKKERYCVLYTNATYLKSRIDDIKNADQLVISMDGDEETHDSISILGGIGFATAFLVSHFFSH